MKNRSVDKPATFDKILALFIGFQPAEKQEGGVRRRRHRGMEGGFETKSKETTMRMGTETGTGSSGE